MTPHPADCCDCGKPFGQYGRIALLAAGMTQKWRCRECADAALYAFQEAVFAKWHEAEIAKRRAAGWHR